MKMALLGLLAETFIHPGIGQTSGVVDLPTSREVTTHYPYIPGSSLKGALREALAGNEDLEEQIPSLFGQQEAAGTLLVSDARLLLLPVRSLHGVYKWVTCPHLLERFHRDGQRMGNKITADIPEIGGSNGFLAPDAQKGKKTKDTKIFLEERSFSRASGALDEKWVDELGKLISDDRTRRRLADQLVVVSDNDFAWFAQFGLAVQARNQLDSTSKTSQNLWYEETLSPDTLMYALLAERYQAVDETPLEYVKEFYFDGFPWLQVGGNETVGQGWFKVTWVGSET